MSDKAVLGLDTSNYTTSAAYLSTQTGQLRQAKKLLPVKQGEKGIRQSDAVFHHTVQLPELVESLGDISDVSAVGVSDRPSCREGSYMPCFLVGVNAARTAAAAKGIRYYTTTHQIGHILAALYSAKRLGLVREGRKFISFHVSGGTTDVLLCEKSETDFLSVKRIGGSNDLKAGQAVDRCGVMLGLDFPCGAELEKLALGCDEKINYKPVMNGCECSMSGIENKCRKLLDSGADPSYIARFCLAAVGLSVKALTKAVLAEHGQMPVIYAGGVMSDKLIADMLKSLPDTSFAEPQFSCDNAAGVALYAAFMEGMI